MPTVADALRQHADDYRKQFGDRMPVQHKRVLSLITKCRTGELGASALRLWRLRDEPLGRPQLQ